MYVSDRDQQQPSSSSSSSQQSQSPNAIITERAPLGSLSEYLTSNLPRVRPVSFPLPQLLTVFRQVAEGLGAVHAKGFLHRSLTPRHVFVFRLDFNNEDISHVRVKLGGLHRTVSIQQPPPPPQQADDNDPIGLMPPEVIEARGTEGWSTAGDIWCLGVFMWKICCHISSDPASHASSRHLLKKASAEFDHTLSQGLYSNLIPALTRPAASSCPDNLWQLVQQCLSRLSGDRPSLPTVIQILNELVIVVLSKPQAQSAVVAGGVRHVKMELQQERRAEVMMVAVVLSSSSSCSAVAAAVSPPAKRQRQADGAATVTTAAIAAHLLHVPSAAKNDQNRLTHVEANYNRGCQFARSNNPRQAMLAFKLAADQGHAAAQHRLGQYLESGGEGVAQDLIEAVRYYQMAADQDHVKAQCNLGNCYAKGRGVGQDYNRANHWFMLAVQRGNAGAMFLLGCQHEKG